MAYWLAARRQLYWPAPSILSLHVAVEQLPRLTNQIALSGRLDRYGVPKASLRWSINDADLQSMDRITDLFAQFWSRGRLGRLGRLVPSSPADAEERRSLSMDIYHPGGSARMGDNPNGSVVDGDLRVWGMPNLFIASTSTFPTGGAANPTMTLLLLGLRLAARLSADLSKSPLDVKSG